jgi:hypothetical protein
MVLANLDPTSARTARAKERVPLDARQSLETKDLEEKQT